MGLEKSDKFGLIGTITHDVITYASGSRFEGLGGILYQAAVLCGLRKEVFLYSNVGEEIYPEVKKITKSWATLHTKGIQPVSGPGNRVFLHYPEQEERVEVLESHVPPLEPARILEDLSRWEMLILVINSGFDIRLEDWRKIVDKAQIPIWFDVHSLALSRELHVPRKYLALVKWQAWAEGVAYLQANAQEVASMLGAPDEKISEDALSQFGRSAFAVGVQAVFITLGKEGVLVLSPRGRNKIGSDTLAAIVDTTGCGDVFSAATAVKLAQGATPEEAALFGVKLASRAALVSGIAETYTLAASSLKP